MTTSPIITGASADSVSVAKGRIEDAIASMGVRIADRRKAMGLTLDQVAERAEMSKSYIWEIENGKNKNPTIRTAWQLARALGWSLSDVIGVWEHSTPFCPEAMKIAAQVDFLLRPAIATEAGAETTEIGSVHEGAGPKDIAQ